MNLRVGSVAELSNLVLDGRAGLIVGAVVVAAVSRSSVSRCSLLLLGERGPSGYSRQEIGVSAAKAVPVVTTAALGTGLDAINTGRDNAVERVVLAKSSFDGHCRLLTWRPGSSRWRWKKRQRKWSSGRRRSQPRRGQQQQRRNA